MDTGEDVGTHWLPIAEAAPHLGMTVDGLRSRIRRGLVKPRKGNDGRLLVPVVMDSSVTGHERSENGHDRSAVSELAEELFELRVSLARAEERLNGADARHAEMRVLFERRERELTAALELERAERAKLAAELAEARRPLLLRLVEALRRRPN